METSVSTVVTVLEMMLLLLELHERLIALIRERRRRSFLRYRMSILGRPRSHPRRTHNLGGILGLSEVQGRRRWWVYPRPVVWWHNYVMRIWSDEQWLEHFRMTKATFLYIVRALRPGIEHSQTHFRSPISVEQRVGIAIWYLANSTSYRVVGQVFGVGRSTVATIVVDVCLVIEAELFGRWVRPGPAAQVMQGFSTMGYPQCVGAIDGCHIHILAPSEDESAYVNRHHRHSVILQAISDARCRFLDATVGNPGHDHDAHVLRCSNVFDGMDAGVWVQGNPTVTIEGVEIPPLIVADLAYPIRRWLMTPYGGVLSPDQARYNRIHNRARNVVERAFGRLKSRWRCLLMQLQVREENLNSVICACVTLHNICETRGHPINVDELTLNQAVAMEPQEPPAVIDQRQQAQGIAVRSALTRWFRRVNQH